MMTQMMGQIIRTGEPQCKQDQQMQMQSRNVEVGIQHLKFQIIALYLIGDRNWLLCVYFWNVFIPIHNQKSGKRKTTASVRPGEMVWVGCHKF